MTYRATIARGFISADEPVRSIDHGRRTSLLFFLARPRKNQRRPPAGPPLYPPGRAANGRKIEHEFCADPFASPAHAALRQAGWKSLFALLIPR
jgi:hypothetical protein